MSESVSDKVTYWAVGQLKILCVGRVQYFSPLWPHGSSNFWTFFTICFLDQPSFWPAELSWVVFFVWSGAAVGLGGKLQTVVALAHSLSLSSVLVGASRLRWSRHRSWWGEPPGTFFAGRKHHRLPFDVMKLCGKGWRWLMCRFCGTLLSNEPHYRIWRSPLKYWGLGVTGP